jgi:hypothetical protein
LSTLLLDKRDLGQTAYSDKIGEENTPMLIVNDEQRRLAGMGSLERQCHYCSQALAEYPLILSDDAAQTVYHAACAVELATEILFDLFTFLSPPAPYERLFVLTASDAAPPQQTAVERE